MNDSHLSPSMRVHGDTPEPTGLRGAPKVQRIGREAYETLMGFLSEDTESPTSALGVFVANSTKRALRRQIEAHFKP
ncbi:hypothetical protein [Pseudomonas phage Alpheus]|uniref:Uncharacterized protein n=1 Tax=Pseudomonas phage Alpheus TaxID=2163983 RepID=A0A2S1GMY6_9CAUD|nr:hypothetical protein HOT11_gp27 [Pseudomonas phage Alpheus]AWD90751.1 hypothetical protein [Pseudomonas phage Alpheus]